MDNKGREALVQTGQGCRTTGNEKRSRTTPVPGEGRRSWYKDEKTMIPSRSFKVEKKVVINK